jgi:hemolysin activation/secretion protein
MNYRLCALIAALSVGNAIAEDVLPLQHCTELVRVDVEDTNLTNAQTKALFEPYLGKCIDKELLSAVVDSVSDVYMNRGNITTRAYLSEQDIADGQIDISVLKGTLENVVDAKTKLSNSRIKTAFAFQKGDILNLRDIESALEMMNRPPSSDVKFDIAPGEKPGGSIIEIKSEDVTPYHLQIGLTGRHNLKKDNVSVTGELSIDNPLWINDILTYRYNTSYVQKEYQGNAGSELNYSFPISDYLVEIVGTDFSYRQGVSGINDTYLSEGDTLGTRLRVSKVLWRNQKNKLTGSMSVYHKDTKNYFADELVEVSSYKTTLAQLDLKLSSVQDWGQLTTVYSFYRGTDWFDARADSTTNSDAKLQFRKHSLDMNLFYRIKDSRYHITSNLHLQQSDDQLYNSDQLSVGSDYTVRGYLDKNLYGNNAWYLNNNFAATWYPELWGGEVNSISGYVGLDYGQVRCESDNATSCGDIYGMALGTDVGGKHLSASMVLSMPLRDISENVDNFDKEVLFKFDLIGKF